VRDFMPVLVFALAVVAIGRSVFQLAAIATFSTSSRLSAMERASSFDPGSYRIQVRLAQAYLARGDCKHERPHADAARALLPNAGEARRLVAACGR